MVKYKTDQRKTIMNYLINNQDKFVTAEEILEDMKNSKQIVSLTTIYRFLNMLENNNNVRVETINHTKYYQYIKDKNKQHLFLKCKNCGKSIDLNCKEFENINNHIKNEHKFNLDYNTIVYGVCEKCNK